MINVQFTENELGVLQQIIHIATQARGLDVAEAAVQINRRLVTAMDAHKAAQAAHAQAQAQQQQLRVVEPASIEVKDAG